MRSRKKKFYHDLCNQNKNKVKKIWQHTNLFLSRNQFPDNPVNAHDLNVINGLFSNLGSATMADLPLSQKHYKDFITPIITSFVLSAVSHNELLNAISRPQNKYSSGFDGLNS